MSPSIPSFISKIFAPVVARIPRQRGKKTNPPPPPPPRENVFVRLRRESLESWKKGLPRKHFVENTSLQVVGMANVSAQEQSPFFGKLPLELRRLIYTYALGGNVLLVDNMGKRGGSFCIHCPMALELLAFPKSCKMAYLEATEYIYTFNTFRLPDIKEFFYLERLAPTDYFQAIQSVEVLWPYQHSPLYEDPLDGLATDNIECWRQTCEEIQKLKGLKKLRVEFTVGGWPNSAVFEEMLFPPVAALQFVEDKVVCTNWPKRFWPGEPEDQVWPFTMLRGTEHIGPR